MVKARQEDSAFVNVLVTPKAGKDSVDGIAEGETGREVRVRVRAVPEDGKANKAVCAVMAKFLGVPKSAVAVVSGSVSRHKRLEVSGLSEEALETALSVLE